MQDIEKIINKILFPYRKYKKMWEKQNSELDIQTAEITKLKIKLENVTNDFKKYNEVIQKIYKKNEEELINQIKILNEKIKKTSGEKGGLKKENNKLKEEKNNLVKENKELQKKLAESMTDKYLVRKIPSGKLPKMQPARIKSSSKQSKIIKKIMEE